MSTIKYKSDAVNRDAVQRYYVISWFGGFAASMPVAILLVMFHNQIAGGFIYFILAVPAVHIGVWIMMGAIMCAQFRLMTLQDEVEYTPPPQGEERFIPYSTSGKNGTIYFDK